MARLMNTRHGRALLHIIAIFNGLRRARPLIRFHAAGVWREIKGV